MAQFHDVKSCFPRELGGAYSRVAAVAHQCQPLQCGEVCGHYHLDWRLAGGQ